MQRLRANILLVFSCLATFLALQSCTSHKFDLIKLEGPCFQEEVLPILVTNCAQSGCHSSTDRVRGYDFSSYDGVMEGVVRGNSSGSEIIEVMRRTGSGVMPPSPQDPLSPEQIETIATWIDAGAYVNKGCKIESCDSLAGVSYALDVEPILDLHCKGCHNINSPGGGYEFENWEQTNGAATTGALIGVLDGNAAFVPMPWNAPALSDCNIKKLKVWVDEGALDN